ncbi:MAG: RNA polymerase sigma factor SigJ [Phenylobacterium sp.]|nr:RNA polymerase sigma factor SigJ [Phenylobacterium sp.]
MTPTPDLAIFEAQRPRMRRLAYRMLGSVAEAEDVVQDAWIRWSRSREQVEEPAAWLVRTTSRLCLDRLRAAKVRREAYRGPWLPEPLIEDLTEDPLERAEDVSVAFLLALERLSPLERAVFLLHEVFDEDYAAVAQTLERSEAAVRQIASRARAHLQAAKPRYTVDQQAATRLASAFMAAAARGDMAGLRSLLAEDAVMVTDGGGKRSAALRPLVGPADIVAMLEGLAWRGAWPTSGDRPLQYRAVRINGLPGLIVEPDDGPMTIAFQPSEDGRLSAIYIIRNPEKLAHLDR